jgi:arylsulfatase A-like enzyme
MAGPPRPNILIIVTDDQRADMMWMMPRTMRWFGARGTEFPEASVATPLCCPSRASIMTGRYVHNHGVADNSTPTLLDQASTVQRYLRRAGYHTGYAGKYLNAWNLHIDPPSFDRWAIQTQGYVGARFNVDGKVRRVDKYSTDFVRDRAVEYLRWFEKQKDVRPWLLYVSPFAPHEPHTPPVRHAGVQIPAWQPGPAVGEEDRTDKPQPVQDRFQSVQEGGRHRELMLKTLIAVDQLVNRVMKQLKRLRETRRTLAIFVSDNGYLWSEHSLYDKRFPYTESFHVPLFARWPGRFGAGAVDPRMASSVDIAPTVLEAAGFAGPLRYPLDGRSLLQPGTRQRVLVEHFVDPLDTVPKWALIRTSTYQYTEWYDQSGQLMEEEYYDLTTDPHQLDNLLGDDDPSNDPSNQELTALSDQLRRDRSCVGTAGSLACP